MAHYWIRNKKGQVAAEVSDSGLSVHDQGLSWQLQRLRETHEAPFNVSDAPEGRSWSVGSLLLYLEENEYTIERRDS